MPVIPCGHAARSVALQNKQQEMREDASSLDNILHRNNCTILYSSCEGIVWYLLCGSIRHCCSKEIRLSGISATHRTWYVSHCACIQTKSPTPYQSITTNIRYLCLV